MAVTPLAGGGCASRSRSPPPSPNGPSPASAPPLAPVTTAARAAVAGVGAKLGGVPGCGGAAAAMEAEASR